MQMFHSLAGPAQIRRQEAQMASELADWIKLLDRRCPMHPVGVIPLLMQQRPANGVGASHRRAYQERQTSPPTVKPMGTR